MNFCSVFVCLQALLKEQKQYLSLLGQLKDYDEELAQELVAKAFQEQEKQRLEVLIFSQKSIRGILRYLGISIKKGYKLCMH